MKHLLSFLLIAVSINASAQKAKSRLEGNIITEREFTRLEIGDQSYYARVTVMGKGHPDSLLYTEGGVAFMVENRTTQPVWFSLTNDTLTISVDSLFLDFFNRAYLIKVGHRTFRASYNTPPPIDGGPVGRDSTIRIYKNKN